MFENKRILRYIYLMIYLNMSSFENHKDGSAEWLFKIFQIKNVHWIKAVTRKLRR